MLTKLSTRTSQKGFTLVEVIVVAVIVAVLAAIAIPLYTGYVNQSRANVAANACGSLASFCGASANSGQLPADGAITGTLNGANGTIWTEPVNLNASVNQGNRTCAVVHANGGATTTLSW